MKPKIGISDFARKRHTPESGNTHYIGCADPPENTGLRLQSYSPDEAGLIRLCEDYWDLRKSGKGETSLDRKVVIELPADFFSDLSTIAPDDTTIFDVRMERRQPEEKAFISCKAIGRMLNVGSEENPSYLIKPLPRIRPKFACVVLYSAAALLENGGTRSTNCDWEIVSMVASEVEDEPMFPLTMARNLLGLPGGTKGDYTIEELARSIVHWSEHCLIDREQYGG